MAIQIITYLPISVRKEAELPHSAIRRPNLSRRALHLPLETECRPLYIYHDNSATVAYEEIHDPAL